jgi:hypothetical protein
MDENYIKSLHYCPICGQVIGCGDGHCDSKEFQEHVANCRLASRGKTGRIRYDSEEEE